MQGVASQVLRMQSDWYGTYSTTEAIKAGLDLEMPGATMWRGERVKYSVIAGKLSPTDIDKCCARVLNVSGLLAVRGRRPDTHSPQLVQDAVKRRPDIVARVSMPETISDDPALTKLNRKIAANSIVLLKNDQNVLPLNKNKIRSIAVIGPNARSRSVTGGGSAFLQSEHTVTALEGITAAVEGANIEAHHVPGCHGELHRGWGLGPDLTPTYHSCCSFQVSPHAGRLDENHGWSERMESELLCV